jgi:hypothetical protein
MKYRDILKPFRQLKRGRRTGDIVTLLSLLPFLLASLLTVLPLPVHASNTCSSAPSMNSTGYGFHSDNHKKEVTYSAQEWFLTSVSGFLPLHVSGTAEIVSRFFYQYPALSSGIRAPPSVASINN